jgi:hypothetical protein
MGVAVVLGAGAYALTDQSGDDAASAGTARTAAAGVPGYGYGYGGPRRMWHRERRDADLSGLASKLKVDQAKLKQALSEIRDERHADGGPAKQLAAALGLPVEKVRDALAKLRPNRPRFAPRRHPRGPFGGAELAKALGVSQDKLDAAIAKLRDSRSAERDQFAAKLADKLGIPESRVKAALPDRHFGGPPGLRRRGGPGPGRPTMGGPPPGGPPMGGPPPGPPPAP